MTVINNVSRKLLEPVAEIALSDDGYKIGLLGALRNHRLPIGTKLYAAPVQQPKCKTCDDNGRIGGPSFYAPDEGGEPCPDCCSPVQQVSVPVACSCGREYPANSYSAGFISGSGMCEECDAAMPPKDIPQLVSVPDARIIPTSAELIQWAWEEEPEETRFQEGYNAAKRWVKMQIEAGIAALSAPSHGGGVAHTDCRSEDGITVGLIDSIITSCRVLSSRDLTCEAVVEALRDLRSDSDVSLIKPSHSEQVREWIPVSERLPNIAQEVIVHSEFDGVCAGVLDSYGEWFAPCSEYKLIRVTSWMPMPTKIEAKPF